MCKKYVYVIILMVLFKFPKGKWLKNLSLKNKNKSKKTLWQASGLTVKTAVSYTKVPGFDTQLFRAPDSSSLLTQTVRVFAFLAQHYAL